MFFLTASALMAAKLDAPELGFSKPEADAMGGAVAGVLAHLPIPHLTPLQEACIHLALTTGTICGPKAFAYMLRDKTETNGTKTAGPAPSFTVPNFK